MKTFFSTFLIALFLLPGFLAAQPGYTVKEIQKTLVGDTPHNTYQVLILQAEKKDVLKGLKHKIEHDGGVKCEVSESIISATAVRLDKYWKDSLDIHTLTEVDQAGTLVFLAFWDDTTCLGSKTHHESDVFIRRFIKDLSLDQYIQAVQNELKAEEKKLLNIEKNEKKLKKDEDKIRLEIKEEELNLVTLKDNLVINEKDRENKINQIQTQKDKLDKTDKNEKEAYSAEKDKLSGYESDLSHLEKQYKDLSKNIFKKENLITDKKNMLEAKLKEIDIEKRHHTEQYDFIQGVKEKLLTAENAR